jgi:hypothetical protein
LTICGVSPIKENLNYPGVDIAFSLPVL